MIPILYPENTTVFTTEGLGQLTDCISAVAKGGVNATPELTIVYPESGIHAADIAERCVILAKPDAVQTAQPYVVKTIRKTLGDKIEIYAVHQTVDILEGAAIAPYTASSASTAVAGLTTYALDAHGITFSTDVATVADFERKLPSTVRDAMGGTEGSILDTYGGEWYFSAGAAQLLTSVGSNRGVTIAYGKNLESANLELDWNGVYTKVYPYWSDGENSLVEITGKTIAVPGTWTFDRVYMADASLDFETEPTEAQLTTWGTNLITSRSLGSPSASWDVKFVELRKMPEYKNIALLETVGIGDTVTIILDKWNINTTARVARTEFDVLEERYNTMEIGNVRASFTRTMASQMAALSALTNNVRNMPERITTPLLQAISDATEAITGNTGGYVVTILNSDGEPQELLIMDTDDINTATNVWRWNVSGLGFSSTGYAGPYTTAITANGEIVADFITTGTLDASQINVVNLIAEHLKATSGTQFIDIQSANLTMKNGSNWTGWIANGGSGQGVLYLYGGTRPNINGYATDPGNDSTSRMTFLDANALSVGLDNNDNPTGEIRTQNLSTYDGSIWMSDANSVWRIGLTADGNIRSYDSTHQERIGLYPAEGQLALYNSSGTRIVQIRADGTASANPLPINQGGTGQTSAFPKSKRTTGSVSASYGNDVTICSLTLPKGYTYLVFGRVQSSISQSGSIINAHISGMNWGGDARTTMSNGGGAFTTGLVVVSGSDLTVNLTSYGYYNGTYTLSGGLLALQFADLPDF